METKNVLDQSETLLVFIGPLCSESLRNVEKVILYDGT